MKGVGKYMKRVLVVGVNFSNKGAQSMLFTLTDEIKKRNPEAEVYYGCNYELYDEEQYGFNRLLYSLKTQKYALSPKINGIGYSLSVIKDFAKLILKKKGKQNFGHDLDLKKMIKEIDLIIDASGYALADFSSKAELDYYLNSIRLAKMYSVPIIIMPQSFGPFEKFSEEQMSEIGKLLGYAEVIFAREDEGKKLLEKHWNLNNVRLSADLVLQNKAIDINNVFSKGHSCKDDTIDIKPNSVAIIPNYHCFDNGDSKVLELYDEIIKKLISLDFNIYIFKHSSADEDICEKLYNRNKNREHVHIIHKDFSCLEYDVLVKKFNFVICSRFHGCVHAYKNMIPCIILGWAIKYVELAKIMNQEMFVFDISSDKIKQSMILKAVEKMSKNTSEEKKKIENSLSVIQSDSCFSVLDKYL